VESKETTETHLAYLRKGLDEVKSDVRDLRGELHDGMKETRANIDALREELRDGMKEMRADTDALRGEMRADSKSLRESMDQRYAKLDAKIEKNHSETSAAISQVREAVASLRGMHIAMVWIVGAVGTLGGLAVTLGKFFHWY